MFEDEPRAIVATPGRWHRRFLKRPGAYAVATPTSISSFPWLQGNHPCEQIESMVAANQNED
jgi:hypothetical protein